SAPATPLLRQPHGFEGFAVIEIRSDLPDLAVAKIEYLPHRRIDQSAAARTASLDPAENENLVVSEIAKVLPHHAVLLPGVADLTNVRLDALASPQSAAAESHRHRREPFNIRVHALEDCIDITPVEGIYHPLDH